MVKPWGKGGTRCQGGRVQKVGTDAKVGVCKRVGAGGKVVAVAK